MFWRWVAVFWRWLAVYWRCTGGVWQCSGSVLAVSLYIVQPFLALRNIKALSVYMGSGFLIRKSFVETAAEKFVKGFFEEA